MPHYDATVEWINPNMTKAPNSMKILMGETILILIGFIPKHDLLNLDSSCVLQLHCFLFLGILIHLLRDKNNVNGIQRLDPSPQISHRCRFSNSGVVINSPSNL